MDLGFITGRRKDVLDVAIIDSGDLFAPEKSEGKVYETSDF
jgi:hypothetical protein